MKFAEKLGAVCMLAIGVVAAFSLDSCKKEPNEEPVTVVFPEAKTLNVQANTTETLNFTINADWILYSDSEWATFNDGQLSASGGAGDITLDLEISDLGQTLEETSTAYLTLAAGSEEHVIYTINRAPEGIEFSITDADGNEVTALTAGWEDYDYYTISANFVFAVSDENKPEWLETEDAVTNNESDPCTAGFKVVDDADVYKYAQSGKIVFANEAGTISFEYDITFPGMDYDDIEILESAGQWNWEVNVTGEIVTHDGEVTDPTFTFALLNDDYVIVNADYTYPDDWAFYVDEAYDADKTYQDEAAAWIHVESDDKKGTVTLSFDSTTSERVASVFAFSSTYYKELSENKFAALFDDDGDLLSSFEYFIIADVKQTTKTGNEKFGVKNGTTEEECSVENTCPEGLDVTSVLADYPDTAYVGYLPYEVGVNYITTVFPVESTEEWWITSAQALDCNGNDCTTLTEYYSFEGGQNWYEGDTAYASISVYLEQDPDVKFFYLVYHDSANDDGPTWILFFYNLNASEPEPEEPVSYGLAVQDITGGGNEEVEVLSECPVELTHTSGCYTVDEVIEDLEPDVVGYVPYKAGTTYATTVTPLDASATWISSLFLAYNSWYDTSLNWDEESDGTTFDAGTSYVSGGTSYPSVDISCYSFPDRVDYIFVAYRTESNFGSFVALLVLYPTEESGETDELGDFMLTGSNMPEVLTSVSQYTGKYDLQAIVDHYDAQKVGIVNGTVRVTYNIAFSGLYNNEKTASWVCDNVRAYNYKGEEYEQGSTDDLQFKCNTTLGYVTFCFASDPGTLTYLVFTDDDGNNYVFFLIYSEPSDDPGEPVFPGDDNGEEEGTPLFAINGVSFNEYDIEDSYSGVYSDFISEVKSNYNVAGEAYIKYETSTDYMVGVASKEDWAMEPAAALDYYGKSLYDQSGIYDIEAGQSTQYNGTSVYATDLWLDSDPECLFYLVWTDESGNSYIFFFYNDTLPSNGDEGYALAVQDITNGYATVEVYDECPIDFTFADKWSSFDAIIGQYDDIVVGYVPFTVGTKYATTVTPVSSSSSWLTENYEAYDNAGSYLVSGMTDVTYVSISAGTSYSGSQTSIDVNCLEAMPSNVDFAYIVYRTAKSEDDAVAMLILYATDKGSSEETEWVAVPSDDTTEWGESVWSALSSEYGTEAVTEDFLYSDGYLNFLNGGGSGFKFATTSSSYRVQLAGSGSTSKCCIQFKVTTNGSISVSAGSSSSGSSRTLLIYAGDTEITNEADEFSESTATTFTHSVTGITDETVISICSKSSGINVFDIQWTPGEGGDEVVIPEGDPLVLTYSITDAGTTVKLPVYGTGLDCVVDWGDDSVTAETSNNPTHTYSATGTYDVSVYGTVPSLNSNFASVGDNIRLTAVKSWGDVGIENMEKAFYRYTNLSSLPEGGSGLSGVTTFLEAFEYCSGLTELPSKLFAGCTNATSFKNVFNNCTSLTTVSSDIFEGCSNATNFEYVLGNCTALTTVPAGLFDACTGATDFSYVFYQCTALTTLPADLFKYNTKVTTFAQGFRGCTALTKIENNFFGGTYDDCTTLQYLFWKCDALEYVTPDIFDGFTKVTNFGSLFKPSSTSALSCESPYTVIGENNVHLYERASYSDYFTAPTSYSGAFSDCTGLTDYANIPDDWK